MMITMTPEAQKIIDVVPVAVVVEKDDTAALNKNPHDRRSRRQRRRPEGRHLIEGKAFPEVSLVSSSPLSSSSSLSPSSRQPLSVGFASFAGVCFVILVFALSCINIETQYYGHQHHSLNSMEPGANNFSTSASYLPYYESWASPLEQYNEAPSPTSLSSSSGGELSSSSSFESIPLPTRRPNDGMPLHYNKRNRKANVGPLMHGGYVEVTFTDKNGECRVAKLPTDKKFLKMHSDGPKLSINEILANGNQVPTKMALPTNLESFPCPPASARHF